MLLELPFLYTVSMTRGTQRKPRDYTVRGYTVVDIEEVASRDLTVVVDVRSTRGTYGRKPKVLRDPYRSWGEHLVLPVRATLRPVAPTEFERELAEGTHPFQRRWPARPFGPWHFPSPDIRMGHRPELDPMRHPTFAELKLEMEGEDHPPAGNDFAMREIDARVDLPKTIVIVDGHVHAAVPEPGWRNDIRQLGMFLERSPEIEWAYKVYRADRSAEIGGSSTRASPTSVKVSRPDLLRRDDVVQLARGALALWPKWRLRALSAGGDIAGPDGLFEIVDRIMAGGKIPAPEECFVVLETYCKARTALAARGQRFWDNGHSVPDRAGAIASRWRRERAGFVAKHGDGSLSQEDLDALEGIV